MSIDDELDKARDEACKAAYWSAISAPNSAAKSAEYSAHWSTRSAAKPAARSASDSAYWSAKSVWIAADSTSASLAAISEERLKQVEMIKALL